MTITQRLAVWRIRWMLRIGWGTTDAQIAQACSNWNWRGLATGADIGEVLSRLYGVMGRAPVRSLLLSQVGKPRGWATETPESDR